MELKDRILKARTTAKLTQEQLGLAVGKTRGAVAQWESGEVRPRHTTIQAIARALSVSASWLTNGAEAETAGLEVVGDVAGGIWREGSLEFQRYIVPVAPHPGYPAHAQRLYRVSGTSVNKIVDDGEFIHCVSVGESGVRPEDGDLVVVERIEHGLTEYTTKRLRFENGIPYLRPESFDPAWQSDIELEGDDGTEIRITDIVIAKWSPIGRGKRTL